MSGWVVQPRWSRHPAIAGGMPRRLYSPAALRALIGTCTSQGCGWSLHFGSCPLALHESGAPPRRRYRVLREAA